MCATRVMPAQSGEVPLSCDAASALADACISCLHRCPWLRKQCPKCCISCHGCSQCSCWAWPPCPPCPVWTPECCMCCPGRGRNPLLTMPYCGSASALSRHGSVASLVDAAGPPAGGSPQGLTEHAALTERTWSAPGHIDVAMQQQQLEPRSSGLGAVGATGAGSRTAAVGSITSSVGPSPGETCCSMPRQV